MQQKNASIYKSFDKRLSPQKNCASSKISKLKITHSKSESYIILFQVQKKMGKGNVRHYRDE